MIRGLYTAASGLVANLRRQESVANNVANLNTPGYKAEAAAMSSFESALVRSIGPAAQPVPLTLTTTLGAPGSGAYVSARRTFLEDGELRATDSALDVALRGSGFFALAGPTGTLYTRDGHFHRDSGGFLVNDAGLRVLGSDGQPIALPSSDPAAGFPSDRVSVSATGELRLGDQALGALQIVQIPAGQLVRAARNTYVSAGGVTAAGDGVRVVQRSLEQPNVDAGRAVTDLMAVAQQFESNQRVFLALNDNLQRAVRDIGRVG